MRTTSKKKPVRRKAPAPKADSPRAADQGAPEKIEQALDTLCTQWLTEHKDREVTSLEELVLLSTLALLGGAKQCKVVAQALILALKVAENDPNVAETLRGSLKCLFIRLSAAEDEMEFRVKQAKKSIQLDGVELKEEDRIFIKNQRGRKRSDVYKAKIKKGPKK